jgi:hypothetical protein
MALVLANRVQETTTTTGTGTVTLAGAVSGFQSFAAIGNANTTYYTITSGANWEVGIGTYTAAGTLLARTTILSSSAAGAAITLAGTSIVFATYPAEKSVNLDASGNATALGTPASGTVTNFTGTASIDINGTVGATTAAAGLFTTLGASAAVTLSPANANVVLSPTGTGVVTISPATAGTINRMSIGATTASTGAFTTLGASAAVTLSPASANVVLSPTGTGVVTISPATAGTINNCSIGATTATTGAFTTLAVSGIATFTASPQTDAANGFVLFTGDPAGYNISRSGSNVNIKAAGSVILNSGGAAQLTASLANGVQVAGVLGATTSLTTPLSIGGTGGASTLTLQSTSGAGTSDAIIFKTASQTERMRITSAGDVGIGTSSPGYKLAVNGAIACISATSGLGYGTGSGGAVTQITSRTTGVTLDKPNGAITLVSAAGSVTYQSFTVTNSTVAATDTVIVSQKSGTDLNMIFVTAVAAGSFRISFATTGGTTTEQPVFNFAVIKAVAA